MFGFAQARKKLTSLSAQLITFLKAVAEGETSGGGQQDKHEWTQTSKHEECYSCAGAQALFARAKDRRKRLEMNWERVQSIAAEVCTFTPRIQAALEAAGSARLPQDLVFVPSVVASLSHWNWTSLTVLPRQLIDWDSSKS